jgi:hypothetical protein
MSVSRFACICLVCLGMLLPLAAHTTSTNASATVQVPRLIFVVSPASWVVWCENGATSDIHGAVYGTSASDSGIGVKGLTQPPALLLPPCSVRPSPALVSCYEEW